MSLGVLSPVMYSHNASRQCAGRRSANNSSLVCRCFTKGSLAQTERKSTERSEPKKRSTRICPLVRFHFYWTSTDCSQREVRLGPWDHSSWVTRQISSTAQCPPRECAHKHRADVVSTCERGGSGQAHHLETRVALSIAGQVQTRALASRSPSRAARTTLICSGALLFARLLSGSFFMHQ